MSIKGIKSELKKYPWVVKTYKRIKPFIRKVENGKRAQSSRQGVPGWYSDHLDGPTIIALESNKPVYLYIPWIAEHGDSLVKKIRHEEKYLLRPFKLIKGEPSNHIRRKAFTFARKNPDLYRRMVTKKLLPIKKDISGLILTFDWAPVMRVIAEVCHDLEIPVILIPHESVFVDREKYYWDPVAKASLPISDVILGWGGLQKEIFVERGYPEERFKAVGAPKFDTYHGYQPKVTRHQFCNLFGLSEDKKIILFASQPLDSQLDTETARVSQRAAIQDLLEFCEENNSQLIVRLPPSKDNILGFDLYQKLESSINAAVDDANFYMTPPEEALFHSDLVTSVNSTMLFEGVLIGRPALSMKYVEFEQIWEKVGIPAVHNKAELTARGIDLLEKGWSPSDSGIQWAADMFSCGQFDGQACQRIRKNLSDFLENGVEKIPSAKDRFLCKSTHKVDVIAIYKKSILEEEEISEFKEKYNCRSVINVFEVLDSYKELASVDLFVCPGDLDQEEILAIRRIQRRLGKALVFEKNIQD